MHFEEFQKLARLFVVGALDEDEMTDFQRGRKVLGEQAETYLRECETLASAFALSLQPKAPPPNARQDLLARIRRAQPPAKRGWFR